MYRTTILLLFAGAALALITGCPPDFSPYWKVDKLRVMAIQADPVVAKQGEPVTLSALVWAPDDQHVEYDWSWCPMPTSADDGYECPLDAEDFDQFGGDNGGGADDAGDSGESDDDIFDLGDDEEAIFISPLDAETVRGFCQAIQAEIIEETDDDDLVDLLPSRDCEEGWEVSVRLEVETDDDSLIASKSFVLWGGGDEYNQNPRLEKLQARPLNEEDLPMFIDHAGWNIDEDADHDDQWVAIDAAEPLTVVENIPVELRSLVDPDSVQQFTPSRSDEPREESFDYRWFTSAGPLLTSSGAYIPGSNTLEDAATTAHWLDADELHDDCTRFDDGACLITMWSVVRDTRLGVDWIQRQLRVETPGGDQ